MAGSDSPIEATRSAKPPSRNAKGSISGNFLCTKVPSIIVCHARSSITSNPSDIGTCAEMYHRSPISSVRYRKTAPDKPAPANLSPLPNPEDRQYWGDLAGYTPV